MRQGTIVYFQCNNWTPYPEEASRFIYDYLEGDFCSEDPDSTSVLKTPEEIDKWIRENDLCINQDLYDMSNQYWVTTTKEWLEENFPELLGVASEIPEDDLWVGDHMNFLQYREENVGCHLVENENTITI